MSRGILPEMLPDQDFDGFEMPFGEVLEATLTIEQGFFRGGEGRDRVQQMTVVVHQLEFDGA